MADYKDNPESTDENKQETEQEATRLASYVYEKFVTSERARQSDEDRWLLDAELIMQATLDKEKVSEKLSKETSVKEEQLISQEIE